jgi:predicted murein hydrolase (TIGR00659 family)
MNKAHLAAQLLAGIPLTIAAYGAGVALQRRLGGHALANPVLLAIAIVIAVLQVTGLSCDDYIKSAGLISASLGPATVALAVPLYAHGRQIRGSGAHLVVAAALGAAAAAASAAAIAWACGAPDVLVRSLAPRSATTAIAIGVSEQIGGLPALTAVLLIVTAIGGAMLGGSVLTLAGLREPRARGLAIGVAAQAIGTACALARDETEGAYAGLGMTLAGVLTGLLLPTVWNAFK